ncbi:MAG: hypothetical protein ACKO1G_10510, partial [Microcystis aeruginosa]
MKTFVERYWSWFNWTTLAMVVLGFWLSASFVIDLIILPSLSVAGMMTQNGFASAGYLLFGIFNHLEPGSLAKPYVHVLFGARQTG